MNSLNRKTELYQQMILEHNRNPRNFKKNISYTHKAEGYNPLCGDHYHIFLKINDSGEIQDIAFEGEGCAISKASASLMTEAVKGRKVADAEELFRQFHRLAVHKLDPEKDENELGKLAVFSGVWQYPSRVKCAVLIWHAMKGAFENKDEISTEEEGDIPELDS